MALGRAATAVLPLLLPRAVPAAPALVEDVEFVAGAAPAVRIHVSAERPAHAQTLPPSGGSPHRIYVDLSGTRLAPSTPKVITGAGAVRRVRVGQFEPGTSRVVLDLDRPLPFALSSTGGIVTVQVAASSLASGGLTDPLGAVPLALAPLEALPAATTADATSGATAALR